MNYKAQLNPWVVHQLLPNLQQRAIARFRTRNEAEGYRKVIEQLQANTKCVVVFEVKSKDGKQPVPANGQPLMTNSPISVVA